MFKRFVHSLLLSPALLSTAVLAASAQAPQATLNVPQPESATVASTIADLTVARIDQPLAAQPDGDDRLQSSDLANELADGTTNGVDELDQVTSVSQLTDVKPTDWSFQALQSLVERYGCIVGYPDRTYRGNRALTRYEFAAGLNACLDRVNELIAAGTADLVKKEDLAILQKLQEYFAPELVTLRGRIDGLEARTATLEKQQFSPTTKLGGEIVFALAGVAAGNIVNGNDVQKNTILGDRIRLDLDTSFNGEDLLRVRLQAGNVASFSSNATFTPEGDLRLAADSGNSVEIDALLYQFKVGERTTIVLEANAGAIDDFTNTVNPFLDGDGGSGALSQFGTRNPIYYLVNGAGIGITHKFSDNLELSLGYLANEPEIPTPGSGLFNGPFGAIAQLTFTPFEPLAIGLTYIRAYNNNFQANGSGGSNNANFLNANFVDSAFNSDSFGLEASFQLSPKIVINGSVGYTSANVLSGTRGSVDIWNWAVGLAFPDLFRKGSVAGIIVGMEPKVTRASTQLNFLEDRDTSLHVEGFYQFQLTDNIAITPGIIWLTAPDHNSANSDIVIGVIRTTFVF
ncbi:iron uptake porin [Phormidium sp. FACHB-592]|uniref:Iron uptake porin n=1 Tax=Stenomitos frigidus AS-A4 TaxID=2933935 RepID=A0ABV0KCW5_9CYAN|nr:iron uptake porin [Phormidium sp. FACHB-592]MBD2077672.1 iron uptake porin [Phormidium sp. FACHB-592]